MFKIVGNRGHMKNEKFIRLWEKEKKKGKTRYVLFRTAIMGISFAIGTSIGFILREGWPNSINGSYFLFSMLGPFIGGCIGGTIGSLIAWQRSAERYAGIIKQKKETDLQTENER